MDFLPQNLNPFGSQERKKLEKLSRELLNYPLFQLRANATYSLVQMLMLFVACVLHNKSAEARCRTGKYPSADDALLHIRDKTTGFS